ncbi:hypothetical protein [Brevibacillus laterosporus]|uniref:hypothetical protein n=1 Tax=Brevibacillus laterosporus TaxID=1465 RepID=UPI0011B00C12|nr:hypothetical protein [Brevibacillus laterosporus]MED1666445.1 hypothetical protein [Brevibacillus laterosporus]MED1667521.1 hypothetical protein [Brevibacillus laterosporus]MED1719325.1 hypothetical protein [Brevibacillus laterosporus]
MEIRLFMRLLANLTISFNQGLMFHHEEINHLPTNVVFLVTTKRREYYVVCGGNSMKEVTILFSSGAQIQFNAVEFKGFSWTDQLRGLK